MLVHAAAQLVAPVVVASLVAVQLNVTPAGVPVNVILGALLLQTLAVSVLFVTVGVPVTTRDVITSDVFVPAAVRTRMPYIALGASPVGIEIAGKEFRPVVAVVAENVPITVGVVPNVPVASLSSAFSVVVVANAALSVNASVVLVDEF